MKEKMDIGIIYKKEQERGAGMTNADMMVVFDAIMTILGVYIVFSTIKMKKEGLVPLM